MSPSAWAATRRSADLTRRDQRPLDPDVVPVPGRPTQPSGFSMREGDELVGATTREPVMPPGLARQRRRPRNRHRPGRNTLPPRHLDAPRARRACDTPARADETPHDDGFFGRARRRDLRREHGRGVQRGGRSPPTVDVLAELAGDGPAPRARHRDRPLALPLRARGVHAWPASTCRRRWWSGLRVKPGGAGLAVTIRATWRRPGSRAVLGWSIWCSTRLATSSRRTRRCVLRERRRAPAARRPVPDRERRPRPAAPARRPDDPRVPRGPRRHLVRRVRHRHARALAPLRPRRTATSRCSRSPSATSGRPSST